MLERQNREWGASAETLESIERFRRGAVACISGQQVGVLGGPLYSVLKAVSALQMAEELTAQGTEAIPLFWLATEDHDLAEIASVTLPSGCELEKLTATEQSGSEAPVGRLPLEARIAAVVERATQLLGPGWVSEALRESYRAGESYGSAFARLFTRLLAGTGLVLVDPLDDELHRIAQPLLAAAAERAEELDEALLERGRALHARGLSRAGAGDAGVDAAVFAWKATGARCCIARATDSWWVRSGWGGRRCWGGLRRIRSSSAPTCCCGRWCRIICFRRRCTLAGRRRLPTLRRPGWCMKSCWGGGLRCCRGFRRRLSARR